jgi:hypothetical protein
MKQSCYPALKDACGTANETLDKSPSFCNLQLGTVELQPRSPFFLFAIE